MLAGHFSELAGYTNGWYWVSKEFSFTIPLKKTSLSVNKLLKILNDEDGTLSSKDRTKAKTARFVADQCEKKQSAHENAQLPRWWKKSFGKETKRR